MKIRTIKEGALDQIYLCSKHKTDDFNKLAILDNIFKQLKSYNYSDKHLYYQYHDNNHQNYYLDTIDINDINISKLFDILTNNCTSFISNFTLNETNKEGIYILSCKGYIGNFEEDEDTPIKTVDEKFNESLKDLNNDIISNIDKNNKELKNKIIQEVKKHKYLTGREINHAPQTEDYLLELKERNQKIFDNLFKEAESIAGVSRGIVKEETVKTEYDLRLFKGLEFEPIEVHSSFGSVNDFTIKCSSDTALIKFLEDQLAIHNIEYNKDYLDTPLYFHLSNGTDKKPITNYSSINKPDTFNTGGWIKFVGFSRIDNKPMFSILNLSSRATYNSIEKMLNECVVDLPKDYSVETLFNFINEDNIDRFGKYLLNYNVDENKEYWSPNNLNYTTNKKEELTKKITDAANYINNKTKEQDISKVRNNDKESISKEVSDLIKEYKSDINWNEDNCSIYVDPEIGELMNEFGKELGASPEKIDRFKNESRTKEIMDEMIKKSNSETYSGISESINKEIVDEVRKLGNKNFQQCSHLEVKDEYKDLRTNGKDALELIFNMQKSIQEDIYGYDFEDIQSSIKKLKAYIDMNEEAIRDEDRELQQAITGIHTYPNCWKPWKSKHEEAMNRKLSDLTEEELKELHMEWIDKLHFFMSEGIALGLTPELITNYYVSKNKHNIERQQREGGY